MEFTVEYAKGIRDSDSGLALLVWIPEYEESFWIPNSQILEESEVYKPGTEGELVVTEWLATEKGWI